MATMPKPDLLAHREALRLSTPELVQQVVEVLGRKLTAYLGGVQDVRAVDRWIAGGRLYGEAEERLRFAFQVTRMLRDYDSAAVIQAWMTGMNPELEDRVPLRLLREGKLEVVGPQILRAARAFLAGG